MSTAVLQTPTWARNLGFVDRPETGQPAGGPPAPIVLRFLDPQTTHIHLGNFGALHVTVRDEGIYRGVYALDAFPVSGKGRYISLRFQDSDGQEHEIGIIRDLAAFPPQAQKLVREALERRYFIHTIEAIKSIRLRYKFLEFEVETDRGPMKFLMRWRHDRAVEYGERGKMLLDVDENCYLVPDVEALPGWQRDLFRRYIYW